MLNILAVALGGAIGASLRYGLNGFIVFITKQPDFVWSIFLINIIGCFTLGVLLTLLETVIEVPHAVRIFFTVGLLSSFTTFSTFSHDIVLLIERGDFLQATFYLTGSVLLGVISLLAGMKLAMLYASTL